MCGEMGTPRSRPIWRSTICARVARMRKLGLAPRRQLLPKRAQPRCGCMSLKRQESLPLRLECAHDVRQSKIGCKHEDKPAPEQPAAGMKQHRNGRSACDAVRKSRPLRLAAAATTVGKK